MSTQGNILHDSPSPVAPAAYAAISPLRHFSWSVLREIWDNHSLYLAPAIVAGLFLLGFCFGPFGVTNMTYAGSPVTAQDRNTLIMPYGLGAGLIMATSLLVSVFYSLDSLYAERRDRSILFWKSLPVSDLTTVLAKASVPLLVLPLITLATIVVLHLIMAVVSSVVLMRLGDPVVPFWSRMALPGMWSWLLVHLVTTFALWYAPFYAWLFLVSAWVTRAPLLWALLPPLALSVLEVAVFHTTAIGSALKEQLARGNLTFAGGVNSAHATLSPTTPAAQSPALWIGLLIAVIFFATSVQLRRYKSTL